MSATTRCIAWTASLGAVLATLFLVTKIGSPTRESLAAPGPPLTSTRTADIALEATLPNPVPVKIDAHTRGKYRYLFERLDSHDPEIPHWLVLLQSREVVARAASPPDSSETLQNLDHEILAQLPPSHRDLYLALRDSDAEQRAAGDFIAGIELDAPMTDLQQRELLLTKLRHKRQFAVWREQSGLLREQLSAEERAYAHDQLERALNEYRDAYLIEVRAHLDEAQFQRLSDYERTEFELELQRLQQVINER